MSISNLTVIFPENQHQYRFSLYEQWKSTQNNTLALTQMYLPPLLNFAGGQIRYRLRNFQWREIRIPAGHYTDMETLVDKIAFPARNGAITLDTQQHTILFEILPTVMTVELDAEMQRVTGLPANFQANSQGRYNLFRGREYVFVLTDVCDTQALNETSIPLLGVLPVMDGGEQMHFLHNAVELRITKPNIQTFTFNLKYPDQTNVQPIGCPLLHLVLRMDEAPL
jgi:hypothetical protein